MDFLPDLCHVRNANGSTHLLRNVQSTWETCVYEGGRGGERGGEGERGGGVISVRHKSSRHTRVE